MEKVKSSYFRYRIFGFIVSILNIALYALFFNKFRWFYIPIMAFCSYMAPFIFLQDENSKMLNGVYFSNEGLSKYHNNVLLFQIQWKELHIEKLKTLFSINKSTYLKITSIENSEHITHIHIEWFQEESILNLVKKYCPKENELYEAIKKYSIERKISF